MRKVSLLPFLITKIIPAHGKELKQDQNQRENIPLPLPPRDNPTNLTAAAVIPEPN